MEGEYRYFQNTDDEIEPQTICDLSREVSHYLQGMMSVQAHLAPEPGYLDGSRSGLNPAKHLKPYSVFSVVPYFNLFCVFWVKIVFLCFVLFCYSIFYLK